MPSFRAYPISKNRRVSDAPSVVIVCENDQDGLRQARRLVTDEDIELWDGPRFIARLKPEAAVIVYEHSNESGRTAR